MKNSLIKTACLVLIFSALPLSTALRSSSRADSTSRDRPKKRVGGSEIGLLSPEVTIGKQKLPGTDVGDD